jgi:hypothetical protein
MAKCLMQKGIVPLLNQEDETMTSRLAIAALHSAPLCQSDVLQENLAQNYITGFADNIRVNQMSMSRS